MARRSLLASKKLCAVIPPRVLYAGLSSEVGPDDVTQDALSLRMLRISLLDPVNDTVQLLRRLQENDAFRSYLHKRRLRALPLVVAVALTSLTLTAAVAIFVVSAYSALGFLAMMTLVPIVLIGSFWVQVHALLSWLEGRSLVRQLPSGRSRDRGPVNRWVVRRTGIDMGPSPEVPWIPTLVLFVLPAAALVHLSAPVAGGLAALLLVAAVFYAARDRVIAAGQTRKQQASAPAAAAPASAAPDSRQAGELDFTGPGLRSRLYGAIGRVH